MRWLDSITDSKDMNLSKHLEKVEDRGAWRAAVHGVAKSRTRLSKQLTGQIGNILGPLSTDLPLRRLLLTSSL